MFERLADSKPFPLQLRVEGGQRILAPLGEAILGWPGGASAGAAQPLTVPSALLAPRPASTIVYACNLPAAGEGTSSPLSISEEFQSEIGRELEARFLATSLPGGQSAFTGPDGEETALLFRWICISSDRAVGAVWRCFFRMGRGRSGAWRAIEHDYIFNLRGGFLLNPPGDIAIPLTAEISPQLTLEHPDGMLTSFPCSLGRVKVTRLAPDGWPRRHVLGVIMQDDNRIVVFFSDGRREIIATAAPSSRRAARAAA